MNELCAKLLAKSTKKNSSVRNLFTIKNYTAIFAKFVSKELISGKRTWKCDQENNSPYLSTMDNQLTPEDGWIH